jgi:hypothetical protein
MTEAELDNGGSKENKLRSTRSHHFDKSAGRSVFLTNPLVVLFFFKHKILCSSCLAVKVENGSGSPLYERRRLIEKEGKIEDWRILLSDPMTLIKDG